MAVTRKVTLDDAVDIDEIARATEGFSGADLQALIYNANLEAVHSSINIDIAGTSARDEEEPIEFTTFGGPNSKAVQSKAEKMALQKRVCVVASLFHDVYMILLAPLDTSVDTAEVGSQVVFEGFVEAGEEEGMICSPVSYGRLTLSSILYCLNI